MHEVGLMAEMLDVLAKSAAENRLQKISKIKLVIGKMTMALPSALEFAFASLKTEPLFTSDACLEIEERPTIGHCRSCGHTFTVEDNYRFVCPACGELTIEIVSGRELYIEHYQAEEAL